MFSAPRQAQLEELTYVIKRTRRRTLALSVRPDGRITAHAPRWLLDSAIQRFARAKLPWLRRTLHHLTAERPASAPLTRAQLEEYRRQLLERLPERVAFWASRMQVTPGKISVGFAKGRWGSCSRHSHVRFSARLAMLPDPHLDYVVVHELAHLRYLNHSRPFWVLVETFLPDHKRRRAELRAAARSLPL